MKLWDDHGWAGVALLVGGVLLAIAAVLTVLDV